MTDVKIDTSNITVTGSNKFFFYALDENDSILWSLHTYDTAFKTNGGDVQINWPIHVNIVSPDINWPAWVPTT
jgi:hypothetical protein